MKRDIRLIKRVLEHAEAHADGAALEVELDGIASHEVQYHVELCADAGFLKEKNGYVRNLTWSGHNALDKLRAGCDMADIADCTP